MRLRARLSLAAAGLSVIVLFALRSIGEYVTPFLLALFFAAIIDPLVNALEAKNIPRSLGAFVVILSVGTLCMSALWMLAVNLIKEIHLFSDRLPEYMQALTDFGVKWQAIADRIRVYFPHVLPHDDGVKLLLDQMSHLATQLVNVISQLPGVLAVMAVTAMTTFFLSRDKRRLGRFLMRYVPRQWRTEVIRLKDEINAGLIGFVKAQAILVIATASLSIVGLSILRSSYAWGLGLLAGIMDLVPMVGPSAVFAPLVVIGIAADDWYQAIGVGCVWGAVLVLRQLIEPIIVGRHVGIHPLTSIIAVFLGGKLMGVGGILLGPVVAVTIKAVMAVSILPYLEQE